jgi:hypothetical protein
LIRLYDPSEVGQSGKAMPAPMLVTTPPQQISRTVVNTVSHENRWRHVQAVSEGPDGAVLMVRL